MAAPVTFTSNGTYTVPSNCTAIQIECWGGGGPGGTGGSVYSGMNAGGGGGGYARKNSFSVTPGQTYTVVVGGQSGTSTFNSTTCSATGGDGGNYVNNGGPGGYGTNGDVLYTGGKGGISGGFAGGGGGSSAGPSNNGNNGGTSGGGAAVSGGGAGGNGCTYSGGNGDAGSVPGGGGGGGWQAYSWGTGGAGASGKVVVTEVTSIPIVTTQAVSNISGTTAIGNGNITDTGTTDVTVIGFCYKVGTSGDPTVSDSIVYDTGSFSTGAYTKILTGLVAGSQYRVRAYATNSNGTVYGTTVAMITGATVEALVIAGGGNGGGYPTNGVGGGGGGGGHLYNTAVSLSDASYTITVGGANQNSIFGQLIAIYGGNGGNYYYEGRGG